MMLARVVQPTLFSFSSTKRCNVGVNVDNFVRIEFMMTSLEYGLVTLLHCNCEAYFPVRFLRTSINCIRRPGTASSEETGAHVLHTQKNAMYGCFGRITLPYFSIDQFNRFV